MKVFISGPMSGKPLYNTHAFYNAERLLKEFGFSVWNPAWQQYPDNTEFTKDDMHYIDNAALQMCDAIYMLEGWEESDGARAEYDLAKRFDKIIIHEAEFEKAKDIATNSIFGLTHAKFCSKPMKDFREEAAKKREALLKLNLSHNIEEELAWDKFKNDLPDICCSNKIDSIEKRYKDLAEDVEDCKKEDERIDIIFGNHADKINSLDGEVEAIKESIGTDDLQGQLDKDFKDVYNELQSVKDMVNDINFGYIDWSSKMSSAIEDIEETRKHVMSFYDGEFIDTFNKVDERLKKLECKTSLTIESIGGLDRRIDMFGEFIDTFNKVDERLKKLEKLVADTDVDYLEARVRGLEETFKTEPKSKGKKA